MSETNLPPESPESRERTLNDSSRKSPFLTYGSETAEDLSALCVAIAVEWEQTKLAVESQRMLLEEKEKPWAGEGLTMETADGEVAYSSADEAAKAAPEPDWSPEEMAAQRRAYINHQLSGLIKHTACQLRDYVELMDNVIERQEGGKPLLILNGEIFSRLSTPPEERGAIAPEDRIVEDALREKFEKLNAVIYSGTSKHQFRDLMTMTDSIVDSLEAMALPPRPLGSGQPELSQIEGAMAAEFHGYAAALIRAMDVCWTAARASLDQPPGLRRRVPRETILTRYDDQFAVERPDLMDTSLVQIPNMDSFPPAEDLKRSYESLNLDVPKDPCPLVWAFKRMQIGSGMLEKMIYSAHGLIHEEEPYDTRSIPPENLTMLVEDHVAQLTLNVVAESKSELSGITYDLSIGLFPNTPAPPNRGPARAARMIEEVMGLYREVGLEHRSVYEESCSWATTLESGDTPIRERIRPVRTLKSEPGRGGKSIS
jgi:hypothetical protein